MQRTPDTIKKGLKKNKLLTIQRYFYNKFHTTFTLNPSKSRTYPIQLALKATPLYNQGHSTTRVIP